MNENVLKRLCNKFGVEWDVPAAAPEPESRDVEDLLSCAGWSRSTTLRMATEEGHPGTPRSRGHERPRAAVSKYGSRTVRGTSGSWGLYEKHFRSEPQLYDPITAITEVLAAASFEVQMPTIVNDDDRAALENFVDWSNAWLHSIEGGLQDFVAESAETLLIYGPSVHEVVWGEDAAGRRHPVKFGYREPSTIDQWILNEREDGLEAIRFDTQTRDYVLEAGTKITKPATAKVLHTAYHQRGLNFEGVPPTRPAIFWRKFKKLLGQIAALTADKYGIPIPKVKDAEVNLDGDWAPADGTADEQDKKDLYADVKRLRAGKAPVIKIPAGLDVEYESPQGAMPELKELMAYADQQMAQLFKNEGALLGQQSAIGSYAQASVKDDQFLRKAPAVARMVFSPVNDLIRLTAQEYLEEDLEEPLPDYPYVSMRLGGQIDASAWMADVTNAMGNRPMSAWPEDLQKAALEKLELPEDTFEAEEPTDVDGTGEVERAGDEEPPSQVVAE